MSNTQLSAELEAEIREKAKEYAQSFGRSEFGYYALNWEAGATTYAVKLHEAQQEIESLTNQLKKQNEAQVANMKLLREENERLKGWKSEASTLLDPILKYGQSKEANISLGESIVDTVLERCKRCDQALQIIKEAEDFIKGIAAFIGQTEKSENLLNEIKTFLDGTK